MNANSSRWFYFSVAVAFAVVAVTGFIPSYFLKVGTHTLSVPPIVHVHAALYFSWAVLNVSQTWLVAKGRLYDHRKWGLLGISLATAMSVSIVLVVIAAVKMAEARGMGVPVKRFQFLNISGVVKFALFFAAAIVFVQRGEIHKRLIVVANSTILGAPIGRLVMLLLVPPALRAGPPPTYAILLILVLGYSPTIAGAIVDWRTRGRPHLVYVIGLVLGLGSGLLLPVLSHTDTWMSIIDHLVTLLG